MCCFVEDTKTPTLAWSCVRDIASRFSGLMRSDIRTAYLARGKVVDKKLSSSNMADTEFGFSENLKLGADFWSMSSFSDDGQSTSRRCAFNKVEYNAHLEYDHPISDGWRLKNRVAMQWVDFPGYNADVDLTREWHVAQSLVNPYAIPYYYLRRAYDAVRWCYWKVGIKKRIGLSENISVVVDVFGDLGDESHWRNLFGRDVDCEYGDGLVALNFTVRLDWHVKKWLSIFIKAHQYDVVDNAVRNHLDRSAKPESVSDLLIGAVGVELIF